MKIKMRCVESSGILANDGKTTVWRARFATVIDYWWKRTRQQKGLSDAVGNSEKYGTAIKKMLFDASLEAGTGEIDSINVDPFKFFK